MAGKMKPRTYLVSNGTDKLRLVKATTRQSAVGFAARGAFQARVPTQDELYELGRQGIEIEDATRDEQQAAAE